jgi:hypothetical protein
MKLRVVASAVGLDLPANWWFSGYWTHARGLAAPGGIQGCVGVRCLDTTLGDDVADYNQTPQPYTGRRTSYRLRHLLMHLIHLQVWGTG